MVCWGALEAGRDRLGTCAMKLRHDHIHLYASDLAHTATWYKKVLGATIIRSRQSDGRERTDLELGGVTIYLGDAVKLKGSLGWTLNEATPSPRLGVDHIGFSVDNIDLVARELIDRGATITYGPRYLRPGAACLFLEAPDGVIIEIIQRDRLIDAVPIT